MYYNYKGIYWIGVDDTKIEGNFVYGDNTPITWNYLDNSFDPPVTENRNNNCVLIDYFGTWYDRNCFEKRGFICEISNQNIDGRIYSIRALNFLTRNHSLADYAYEYYEREFDQEEDDFDKNKILSFIMSYIIDFQEKNKVFINSLVGGACPFNFDEENEKYTKCSDYCNGNVASNFNKLLHWQYVIGIEFQARELRKQLNQIEGVDPIILARFKEILYDYEKKIYRGDTLTKNCAEFLCPT